MATHLMESDDGALGSGSVVLQVRATNVAYNQPVLRIDQAGTSGGAASIKIFLPNPDIEFVESDANTDSSTRGKYEIAVNSNEFQINGRHETEDRFRKHHGIPEGGSRREHWIPDGAQFDAGQGVIGIANALIAPPVDPSNGGVLYVENGSLKYRGSGGTVTTLAPA